MPSKGHLLCSNSAHDEPDKDILRIRRKLHDTITACHELEAEYEIRDAKHETPRGSFCLKTHRGIPYFGYSRMDDRCFVTLYSGDKYGIHCPIIEVIEKDSELFRGLEMHFEALWMRADSRMVIDIGLSNFR